MRTKLVIIASYFCLMPLVLIALILYSLYRLHENSSFSQRFNVFPQSVHYKAIPAERVESSVQVDEEDGRIKVLSEFFLKHKSPLAPYASLIVEMADKYGLDYRLIPSIAMTESNLCKKIPADSFNCWGFGIYGGHVRRFSGFDEAIKVVSKSLAKEYKDKGYQEPEEIMAKYTPSSNGSWAHSVNFFMNTIKSSL